MQLNNEQMYLSHWGNIEKRTNLPLVLGLSINYVELRAWATDLTRADFGSLAKFRDFCKLGDVDADSGIYWHPWSNKGWNTRNDKLPRYIWLSRTKDIVFEAMFDPRAPCMNGYCHYFGLVGRAGKAIMMYNFMYDSDGTAEPQTRWGQSSRLRKWLCE